MYLMKNVAMFEESARAFIALVERIPPALREKPALGVWDVRSLTGHTARAITTVGDYLASSTPSAAECPDAETYLLSAGSGAGSEAVAARGVAAGEALPNEPAAYLTTQLDRVLASIAVQPARRIVSVLGGRTIPLAEYLRTRNFELVVHTMDLSRATGIPHALPARSIEDAASLAARVAARSGKGDTLLLALTGRLALPEGFSVV